MVHGSALSIPRSWSWPPPSDRVAAAIAQFTKPTWLLPRDPPCQSYWKKPCPCNISVQRPSIRWAACIGEASGSQEVPDPSRASGMPRGPALICIGCCMSICALSGPAGPAGPLSAQIDMQQPMQMSAGPLGIPEARLGSGTSWLPDASPMHAAHLMLGRWTLMLHGQGVFQYDWQGGSRGSNQVGFVNWAMAAATRSLGGGQLQLRGMLSAEPWTIGSRGYPLLVLEGPAHAGAPLHDRQHPHDPFT